jgi:hypothetical protein
MPRLIVKGGNSEGIEQSFDLKLGANKVGRTSENDFQIDHPTVSTLHCEIIWMNDAVTIVDRDSTNGTFIDGQRIQQGSLQPGQTLAVGEVELTLDTAKAAISVPRLTEETAANTLAPPPGTVACANHGDVAAGYHCPQCDQNFCEGCVRTLKLLKGHIHKLCPLCSAHCQPIVYEKKRKRRSLLEVVQNTFGFSEKGTTQKM